MNKKEENMIRKMEMVFETLGWNRAVVNEVENFELNGVYVKITLHNWLNSYILESADSIEDAKNNLYEDSDLYSLDGNEEEILKEMEQSLRNNYW